MCIRDRALLLSARVTGYGSEYSVSQYCEKCEERTEHTYDLTKVQTKHEPFHDLEYSQEENLYKITLPKSGLKVEMINFTKEDAQVLEKEKKQKLKHKLEHNATISFLRRAVQTVDGVSDKQLLNKLFNVLPAADASTLKDVYSRAKPSISTMQDIDCGNCGVSTRQEVPFSWAFFRSDI